MNLADLIDRNAAFTPGKPALRFEGAVWDYAFFACRIAALARAMQSQLGVHRGDRVAVLALNRPDYLALLYACARLGAMLVPLNWRLAIPEQVFILRDAGVKAVFVAADFAAVAPLLMQALPQTRIVHLDDAAGFEALLNAGTGDGREPHVDFSAPLLIVYTSGTTGRPKGAVLTQQAVFSNGVMSHHMHAMTADDHVLTVLPFFHVGGLNIQTTPALQLGATVTIHARFAPGDTLAAIAHDRPTLTGLVPAAVQALRQHPAWETTDLTCLRAMMTGSSIVPQKLIDAFTDRGVPVVQVYGATETCPIAIYTRLGGDLTRPGSTGLPGLLCEARIVDAAGNDVAANVPGEILIRGENVLVEYWGNAAATADGLRDGWYWTGDIAKRDADGYVTVLERKRNVIISGGENVYPAEIERVLHDHPAVAEAAAIGVPDPRWQEVPLAFVVLRENATQGAAELRAHVAAQLARFKLPREIVIVPDLPRNALGKVQHFRLREMWGEERG
ncbi:MAG TPA: AMP-binding protein [Acetobacteraceae bacterium]|jgi:fatty-acyl-CoA synthase